MADTDVKVAPPVGAPGTFPAGPFTPTPKPSDVPADETVPGGKYIVGGVAVDAEGRPLGDK